MGPAVPELPEVEITRRGIEPFVLGNTITGVTVRNPDLRRRVQRNIARFIVGRRVDRVARRGKYLLLECAGGSLIVHLGMSGSLRVIEPGMPPGAHDHGDLAPAARPCACAIRAVSAGLWNLGNASRHPARRLGMSRWREFSAEFLHRVSRGRAVGIKQLLMNAGVVVGIGNIYANESLFRAGILPRTRAGRLSRERCGRLAASVRDTLLDALAAGGSSLRDFVHSDGASATSAALLRLRPRRAGLSSLRTRSARRARQRSSFTARLRQR
jgi:formamidopyrimidine-DNA glycosylase